MAGYIHTCDQCGSSMQVHERYVGRTLKCTSCRTEFTAELPEVGDVQELVPASVDESEPGKKTNRIFLAIFLLIPLAGFIWWLGQDQSEGPASSAFREQHVVGEIATVDTGTDRPVLVALDHEAVGALVDMRTGAIQVGVTSLINDDNRFLELEAGTKIRILEYANKNREARVRIIEGPWESRIVWVPGRWIR